MLFQSDATTNVVDTGWTGTAHNLPFIPWTLRMGVSCSASTQPCGTCSITGLLPNAGGSNQRCKGDTSIVCTTDTDCGVNAPCRFYAGPPAPVSAGGVAECYTSEVTSGVAGTVDVDTGALSPDVPLQANLYTGISTSQPCPTCVGDVTPNDNLRQGTCNGGARDTLACDANGASPIPDFGSTSFDCPPLADTLMGALALSSGPVQFSTSTQSVTLSAANPDCRALGLGGTCLGGTNAGVSCNVASQCPGGTCQIPKCFCDTCNNANAEACASNADCPVSGGNPGICGGKRCLSGANAGAPCTVNSQCPGGSCTIPGTPTAPNACLPPDGPPDGCQPVGGNRGECVDGPTDNNCAAPEQYKGCASGADCPLTHLCVAKNRACFLDGGVLGGAVFVSGAATAPVGNTSNPTDLSALFCIAPTRSSGTNSAAGFPGLGRTSLAGSLTFAEKIVVQTVAAGGTVTTAGSGPAGVVETSVQTSTTAGGEVTVIGTFNTGTPPSGYDFLGRLVQITAPAGTAADPLHLAFQIDASIIPSGQDKDTIAIFRNGVGPIPDCLGATQAIPENPCVAARTLLGGGNVEIVVLTSAASDWAMGAPPVATPTPTGTTTPPTASTATATATPAPAATPTSTATPTPAATPTSTATPTPAATPTSTATPVLDHFTCYKAGATSGTLKFPGIPIPPGVSLVDQFGGSTDALKKAGLLCAPTNKLGEDPTASTHPEHLTGYQIKPLVKPVLPINIKVIDQFNGSGLFVNAKKPAQLFVPTTKSLSNTPPTPAAFLIDHFECYQVGVTAGTPKFAPVPGVTLQDQFGNMTVTVKKPAFLCNPVDKNGEDPTAPTHPKHLMCYQIKQTDPVKFARLTGIFLNNQFGPETLDAKKPALLCVPATTS